MFWKKEKVVSPDEKKKEKKDDKKDKKKVKKHGFNWRFWEEKPVENIDYTQPIKDSSVVFGEKYKLLEQKKVDLANSVNLEERKDLIKEIELLEEEVKKLRSELEDLVKKKTQIDFVVEQEKKEREAKEGTPH